MAQPTRGIPARLVCVAINACPQLALELHALAAEAAAAGDDDGDRRQVLDVLAAHGGERFGEKDNTRELAVLERWLAQRVAAEAAPPKDTLSIYGALAAALGPRRRDGWAMARLELGPDPDCSSYSAPHDRLGRCGVERQPGQPMPPLVFVRGRVLASVLCDTALADFGGGGGGGGATQEAQLEAARREYAASAAVLDSIGAQDRSCDDIAQSLADIQTWLAQPAAPACSALTGATPSCEAVRHHLDAHAALWGAIVDRIGARHKRAAQALRDAERSGPYVLRAFVVHDTADGRDDVAVVRRFGKADAPGHFAVLGADGVCRAVRAQDVRGMAVESMWVCCGDDAECAAGGAGGAGDSQGGINTVVADPDDEIFCQTCGYLDSWSYNQIILCDGCEMGIHQMCHDPVVTDEDLLRETWFCSACTQQNAAKRLRIE